jgi:hypothetical protein
MIQNAEHHSDKYLQLFDETIQMMASNIPNADLPSGKYPEQQKFVSS